MRVISRKTPNTRHSGRSSHAYALLLLLVRTDSLAGRGGLVVGRPTTYT